MNFMSINNLVKSFTIPYDCAFILIENKIIKLNQLKGLNQKKIR